MGEWPPLRITLAEAAAGQARGADRIFRGDVRSSNWNGGGDLSGGEDTTATQGYLIDFSSGSAQFQNIFVVGGVVVGADFYSDNWNGAIPPSLATRDTTIGLVGYALDGSTGGAQFVNIFADAGELRTLSILGNLDMSTGGVIRTAPSGQRIEFTNADSNWLVFYSGDAAEENVPYMFIDTIGTGGTRYLEWAVVSGTLDANSTVPWLGVTSESEDGSSSVGKIIFSSGSYGTGGAASIVESWLEIQGHGRITTSTDGTLAAPGLAVGSSRNFGIYRYDTTNLGISVGGVDTARFSTVGMKMKDGTASIPGYGFISDPDTGEFRVAANTLGWTTGGTQRMELSSAHLRLAASVQYEAEPTTTGTAANATWILTGGTVYNLRRNTSARKYKRHINYDIDLADYVLRPAEFYRPDDDKWFIDFIADDLADQDQRMGVYDDAGEIENYHKPSVLAVLAAKINRLERAVL